MGGFNHLKRGEIGFWDKIKELPKSIKIAALLAFVYFIGWGMASPFVPIFYEQSLSDYSTVGVVFFLFYISVFFFSWIIGGIIDKVKPKNMIMLGLLLQIVNGLLLPNLVEVWHFILYTIFHGLTAVVLWVALEAYVRKHSPKDKEMMSFGLYDAGWVAAAVLGAVIGGVLFSEIGPKMFYVISIFAFLAMFVLFLLPDKKKGTFKQGLDAIKLSTYQQEFKDFFRNKELKKGFVNIFIFKFCFTFLLIMVPLFFKEINASYFMIGILYGLLFLPGILEPYYASLNNKKLIVIMSISLVIVILGAMYFIDSLAYLFGLTIVVAVPFSVLAVIFQGKITKSIPKKEVGEMTGAVYSLSHLAAGFGPLTAGIISDKFGLNSIFILGAVFFLLLLALNIKREF